MILYLLFGKCLLFWHIVMNMTIVINCSAMVLASDPTLIIYVYLHCDRCMKRKRKISLPLLCLIQNLVFNNVTIRTVKHRYQFTMKQLVHF